MAEVVKAWLEERLIGEELEVELTSENHGDGYLATLYHDGKDIGEIMNLEFRDMFAEEKKDMKVENVDSPSSEVKSKEAMKFAVEKISCPSTESVICTHVESLHEVFVQLAKYKRKLDEVSEKLQVYCNENSIIPKNFEKGSSCLAKFSLDDQWYRAEVIDNMGDSVKVVFIDYGNTDTVQLENTRALSEEFISLPATSIKCHLHDVHEGDIDVTAATRWLEEKLIEQEISLSIVNITGDCYDCILKKESDHDDVTINDNLYYEFELSAEENVQTEDADKATEETGEVVVGVNNENEARKDESEEKQAAIKADLIDKCIPKEGDGSEEEIFVGRLKQQAPKLGAKESVKCTHVESLSCISIQLLEFQEKFDEMVEKISEYCQNSSKLPEAFEKGNVCLAKSEDGEWYRAELVSVSSDVVDVNFVDYGNLETVLKQNTRAIKKEFILLPAMSVLCQLHDVHETDIDAEKAEEWLHENLVEQEIDIEIIGKIDETYDVIITKKNECVSVNGLLFEKFELQEDTAHALEDTAQALEDTSQALEDISQALKDTSQAPGKSAKTGEKNDKGLVIDDAVAIKSELEKLNPDAVDFVPSLESGLKSQPLQLKTRDIVIGSTYKMHLSFQVTPSLFWCQFDDTGAALLDMMAEIQSYYGNSDEPPFESIPKIGTICCAKFSEDGKWYRGEVCEKYEDRSCMIQFLDYGNAERVDLSNIKELKSQFFSLAKQAIKCSLDRIEPIGGEWSEDATVVFEDVCADKILDVEIVNEGEAWKVIIKTSDDQSIVNHIMAQKGFGITDITNNIN